MASEPIFPDVAPWPAQQASNPRAVEGGNKPPAEEDVRAQFREALLSEKPDFDTKLEQLEAAAARAEVSDDETLGRAGDLVRILRAHDKLVSDVHGRVKAPYLAAGRTCDAEKNALTGRLSAARATVEQQMNAYAARKRQEEAQARAAADAERRKLEDLARQNGLEQALPPAVREPSKREPVRSDSGAVVSTTVEHVAVIEDVSKAFRKVKDDAGVQEAIQKAVQRLVKGAKGNITIPGVRIEQRTKTIAR